ALRAARRLRGTRLDPFGRTHVRRTERALIDHSSLLVDAALARLTPATRDLVIEVAALPDLVRGYEEIKLGNVARMRERASELIVALDSPIARPARPSLVVAA